MTAQDAGTPRRSEEAAGSPTYRPTWADLLDLRAGERVLLVGADEAAADAVRRRGGVLADGSDGRHDVVCVAGERLSPAAVRHHAASLGPDGRLVLVLDNALSPLRAADRLAGRRPAPRPVAGISQVSRALGAAGFDVEQVFGLLRSSAAPTTAFDLTAPDAVRAVLNASLTHVGGWRGALVRRLVTGPPARLALLCPAWLVVARPRGVRTTPLADLVVGKISNRDSEEVKLVRGNPPRLVEKHYLTDGAPTETDALALLERVRFDLAPRLASLPDGCVGADVTVTTWMPGTPVVPAQLDDADLLAWAGRAGAVLDVLHDRTRAEDGRVLVHGDYWLGNLMADGDRVVGVIDWTSAHVGSDRADRDHLVEVTARLRPDDAGFRERLEAVCRPGAAG